MTETDIAYWIGFSFGSLDTLAAIAAVTAIALIVVKLIERRRR